MKRKPNVPHEQTALPLDSQARITWDERGNVEIVSVTNQYDAKRDSKILQVAIASVTVTRDNQEVKNES